MESGETAITSMSDNLRETVSLLLFPSALCSAIPLHERTCVLTGLTRDHVSFSLMYGFFCFLLDALTRPGQSEQHSDCTGCVCSLHGVCFPIYNHTAMQPVSVQGAMEQLPTALNGAHEEGQEKNWWLGKGRESGFGCTSHIN